MSAMARVASMGPDIDASLTCLGFENAGMTGRYEASLQVEGKGEAAELPRAIQGPLTFQASKGTMGKASVADEGSGGRQHDGGLRGQEPGPSRRGNAVRRIHRRRADRKRPDFDSRGGPEVAVVHDGGKRDGRITSTNPWISWFSRVPSRRWTGSLQTIPVLRYILGGNFLSVAVKVTGNLDDPKIRLAPAKEVGQGLVNILARTVKLPVQVFDPPSP